ncbi:MAG: dehydrogenase, partial [Verrucomicrobiota bacterium]
MDTLERKGSGFVGHHGADFMMFSDLWSQIINLQSDQDGSVFLIDWYDKNQCHNNDVNVHDRSNGRIFKVVYNNQKTTRVDLQKLGTAELVNLQLNANDWWVRHARRILQERGPNPEVHAALRAMLADHPEPTRRLRALWALHATGGLTEEIALATLKEKDEFLRAWTVQLLCENGQPSQAAVQEFGRLAKTDPSAVVRLYVASAAQRIGVEQRWEMVAALHSRGEDSTDHNLPLMAWYALEPLAPSDLNRTLAIALDSKLPRVLEFTARRLAGLNGGLDALAAVLSSNDDEARQLAILNGITTALKGQRSVVQPKGWNAAEEKLRRSGRVEIRTITQALALTFGSSQSLDATRLLVANTDARPKERLAALESLLNVKD